MRTFMTTAALVAALAMPAFAEGDDQSTKTGEASGTVKQTTEGPDEGTAARGAMGQQRRILPGAATTGAGNNMQAKDSVSSPHNPGEKTGVTPDDGSGPDNTGPDGGRGGGGGGSGGGNR